MTSLLAAPLLHAETGRSMFLVEYSNPAFSSPKELNFVSEYIKDTTKGSNSQVANFKKLPKTFVEASMDQADGGGGSVRNNAINTIAMALVPDRVGRYKSKLAVYAKDNIFDIRVIDLTVTVGVADPKPVLEFRGPCRVSMTQEIPIINRSEKDWEVVVSFSGTKAYSGTKYFKVPKDSTTLFDLVFCGPHVGTFPGKLTFSISNNLEENFEYKLMGYAEEPLAEGHLKLNCVARTRSPFSVPVRRLATFSNSSALCQTFKVQTDLACLLGAPTIEVTSPGSPTPYEFFINSPTSGVLTGSLSFTDVNSDAMMWYTFQINVEAPFAESEISVEAVVRTAVVVEITLDNPTNEVKTFDVSIDGEGLMGDAVFTLPPKETRLSYELIYSPLREGTFVGSISFKSGKSGQFWYKVNLSALESPPTVIPRMECMMGTSVSTKIEVENPLAEAVDFDTSIEDNDCFRLEHDQFRLLPYTQSAFNIHFTPARLNEYEHGTVIVYHPKFGEIKYEVI